MGAKRFTYDSAIRRDKMTIELSEAQRQVLQETRAVDEPSDFQKLLNDATPEMNRIVREVMESAQPITVALTEMRDLYLSVNAYEESLKKTYDATRKKYFRDAIRLLDTANTWFGEGQRAGQFRVRPVDEVVQASRPWRERIRAIGEDAYVFERDIAEHFGDVNSSGTLSEEVDDLRTLNKLVLQLEPRLREKGLTDELILKGKALQEEAEGRDLLGVLGLRNKEEAAVLRSRILTYAVWLGREARAAGVNACYDDPEARRRFEAASFRNALRRLRPRRRGATAPSGEETPLLEQAPETAPKKPA
jgi:hypothetical protein